MREAIRSTYASIWKSKSTVGRLVFMARTEARSIDCFSILALKPLPIESLTVVRMPIL